jgi:hypothetical protein
MKGKCTVKFYFVKGKQSSYFQTLGKFKQIIQYLFSDFLANLFVQILQNLSFSNFSQEAKEIYFFEICWTEKIFFFCFFPPDSSSGSIQTRQLRIVSRLFYHAAGSLWSGKSYWRGRLGTVDLLVLTRLDELFILKILFTVFTKQPTLMRRSTLLSLPIHLVFFALISYFV